MPVVDNRPTCLVCLETERLRLFQMHPEDWSWSADVYLCAQCEGTHANYPTRVVIRRQHFDLMLPPVRRG